MNNIEKIQISFENCDCVEIKYWDYSDLPSFWINDVIEQCFNCNSNHELLVRKIANSIEITFPKTMLSISTNFDIGMTLQNQLGFRDITGIRIYTYDTIFDYDVIYEDEEENVLGSPNKYQKNIQLDDGSIKVIIKKEIL
jgi:hypothetical protein